jgi:hypothetical protein
MAQSKETVVHQDLTHERFGYVSPDYHPAPMDYRQELAQLGRRNPQWMDIVADAEQLQALTTFNQKVRERGPDIHDGVVLFSGISRDGLLMAVRSRSQRQSVENSVLLMEGQLGYGVEQWRSAEAAAHDGGISVTIADDEVAPPLQLLDDTNMSRSAAFVHARLAAWERERAETKTRLIIGNAGARLHGSDGRVEVMRDTFELESIIHTAASMGYTTDTLQQTEPGEAQALTFDTKSVTM